MGNGPPRWDLNPRGHDQGIGPGHLRKGRHEPSSRACDRGHRRRRNKVFCFLLRVISLCMRSQVAAHQLHRARQRQLLHLPSAAICHLPGIPVLPGPGPWRTGLPPSMHSSNSRPNKPIAEQKQRTAAAAATTATTTCAKASRQSVEGRPRGPYKARGAIRNFRTEVGSLVPHTAHGGIPSPSAEQRRGQSVRGWFLARGLCGKKRPCTGHIFLIAGAQFLGAPAPPLLS
jgi:hypothetical protein